MDTIERRLAAILALDVVGYSRMMGTDEAGTLERLKALRADVLDPAFAEHQGRIVKLMGDGILVEFDSAVHAVQCAMTIQQDVHEAGLKDTSPTPMQVRIGINSGDIIIDGDDIYGDGVNVAARLESIAEAGGICLSGAVHDAVRNKVGASFQDLGEKNLKNIEHPVRVFGIVRGGTIAVTPSARSFGGREMVLLSLAVLVVGMGGWWWKTTYQTSTVVPRDSQAVQTASVPAKTGKPTIAVLPFNNFSNDESQDYFSDGLTEDLITDISKVSGLSVIARNSTFTYKGQAHDVREVGKTLGATHVVEGSVRKAGGTVRITVQLIDAADGHHIWAERYDRELKDIFAIQDEVIGKIIAMLAVKLTPEEEKRVAERGTESLDAFDLFMRGRQQEGFFTKTSLADAVDYYTRAISFDPIYANAYARRSIVQSLQAQFHWTADSVLTNDRALQDARHAIALRPTLPIAHYALGRILGRPQFNDHDNAKAAFKKSVELDPSFADGLAFLALEYSYTGEAARGVETAEKAMKVNPIYPFWYYHARGLALYLLGDYQGAVLDESKALERNPTVFFIRYWMAAALAQAGQVEEAQWQVDELRGMGYDLTLKQMMEQIPVQHPPYRAIYEEGLRKAGFK